MTPRIIPCIAAFALLASPTRAAEIGVVTPKGQLTVAQIGAATKLTLVGAGGTRSGILPPDDMIAAHTLQDASFVAVEGAAMLVVTTTYASQTGQGGPRARCAAGQETVLRVIALEPNIRQTAAMRVESCWDTIDRTPIAWDDETHSLKLDADSDSPESYFITADGTLRRDPATDIKK